MAHQEAEASALATAQAALARFGFGSPSKVMPTGREFTLGRGYYRGGANLGPTVRPTAGRVTSEYGPRNLLGMSFHNGIDIANAAGTPTRSAARAKVLFAGYSKYGYGNYVLTQSSDGTILGYGHHNSLAVKAGQQVAAGQMLGRMGSTGNSTGPHLHFQTGRSGNWFNPRSLFPGLESGGITLNDGYAMLHKKEAVLTEPLTAKLQSGIENYANGGPIEYNVEVNINGPVNSEIDIKKAVKEAFIEIEKDRGPKRKIGSK